jgi:hypothetical protein
MTSKKSPVKERTSGMILKRVWSKEAYRAIVKAIATFLDK